MELIVIVSRVAFWTLVGSVILLLIGRFKQWKGRLRWIAVSSFIVLVVNFGLLLAAFPS